MNDELFLIIIENEVLTLTLNRADIHNAFNDKMILDLTNLFYSLNERNDLRLVVIQGEGKSFCAGADINWMKRMKNYSDEENYQDSLRLRKLFEAINDCTIPVIAKVHGAVLGGGTGLIACCDFVLASNETIFGFTEVSLGLLPAVISPFVMAKIKETYARAYFLSGERFGTEIAKEMGLIHRVCESSELEDHLKKLIDIYLKAGPIASKEAKKLIKGVISLQHVQDVEEFTCQTIARIRTSEEGQEGMTALLQKRKPNWVSGK